MAVAGAQGDAGRPADAVGIDAAALWCWSLCGVVGLTVLRWLVLALSPLELHGDEAQYWTWSRSFEFGYFTKPPLIAWIIATTTGVFGDAAFGVRFAAPLCHGIAAVFIGLSGRQVAGPAVGAWAMLAYATLPAVSFSSLIMSTDAPLLACWAVALWAYLRLLATRGFGWAVLAGLGIAVGLNAKYAMGFFLVCAGLHMLLTRDARWLLRSGQGWTMALIGLAGLIPNLIWNIANDWATVGHTAENANWGGPLLHLDRGLEFAGAQFGVFGPILFVALLALFGRWVRGWVSTKVRLFLLFSAPILALITVQAFLSRAHANWAATAYVAAVLAVVPVLLNSRYRRWLWVSFGLHGFIAAGLYLVVLLADVLPWPEGRNPFAPLRGWDHAAEAIAAQVQAAGDDRVVVSEDRMLLASLIHAGRESGLTFAAFDHDGVPGNHYELTMPYDSASAMPAVLVSKYPEAVQLLPDSVAAGERVDLAIPVGDGMERSLYLWLLN